MCGTVYVVKVLANQGRDLWLNCLGDISEHFSHCATYNSATEATLDAMRTALPYDFEVIPTTESELEKLNL